MAKGPRQIREFEVNPQTDDGEPLCIGLFGPPGAGKTVSALRIAEGMARVRGGKPALIDTEGGRALKYRKDRNPDGFDFDYIPFRPPFEPAHFMDAINQAALLKPSAIIIDNASNEHEGPGGVLEWHDREVPNVGGNEWAAWNAPKASRRVLTSGIQQIKIPIILTFWARQKTKTQKVERRGRTIEVPVNIGYMPIAGEELIGILDLACLLPPRSNGVAVWSSEKAGEDFTIKLPWFLARLVKQGAPLDQDLGEALARWQLGPKGTAPTTEARRRTPMEQVDAYIGAINNLDTLDALREYQADPRRLEWVEKLKATDAGLFDRLTEAQSKRYRELSPQDDDDADDIEVEVEPEVDHEAEGDDEFPS